MNLTKTIFSVILFCLCFSACAPKPPNGVPMDAVYSPKGSYAWEHCSPNDSIRRGIFECDNYGEAGQFYQKTFYIKSKNTQTLDKYPAIVEEIRLWTLSANDYKDMELMLVFRLEKYPRETHDSFLLTFADASCVEYLLDGRLSEFDKYLNSRSSELLETNKIMIQFKKIVDKAHPRDSNIRNTRADSKCLSFYYYEKAN